MKNPRDKSQIMMLAKQMYPGNSQYFIQAFEDATKNPYTYIRIDLTPDTLDGYRLTSRLTPEEFDSIHFAPIVYRPNV